MEYSELKELVDKRLSGYQIANVTGRSHTSIRHWLKKYSLKTSKLKVEELFSGNSCKHCNKPLIYNRDKRQVLYCDNTCQGQYTFINVTLEKFKKGELSQPRTLINSLSYLNGYKCVECSNEGMHNGKKLSLQLDHKDGNAGNNTPENLRLLCPNCHTQTPTYGSKNAGNGRGSRGLKR